MGSGHQVAGSYTRNRATLVEDIAFASQRAEFDQMWNAWLENGRSPSDIVRELLIRARGIGREYAASKAQITDLFANYGDLKRSGKRFDHDDW